MASSGHLWAVGFDDIAGAERLRDEIVRLGWGKHYLVLSDVAVVARHADGSFTLEREPFPAASNILGCSAVGLLAGLLIGAPAIGAAVGALVGGAGSAAAVSVGISNEFVEEVKGLMKPGTSALFVLDSEGEMEVILHGIRGLGGTVLKTNVDVERARLIQSTLSEVKDPPRAPSSE
jgi:uncharacterized membrane protein